MKKSSVMFLCWIFFASSVGANPAGGQISGGTGQITQNGGQVTITQSSEKLSINWRDFSIRPGEAVRFIQPGSRSIALNRVNGLGRSDIFGSLTANGQVFLLNPNGILFAPGAQVQVGGLVATSLGMTDSDFFAGKYVFSGSGTVANQGTIAAKNYALLLGNTVTNEGKISVSQGFAGLAAGKRMTVDFYGDGLLNLSVDQAAIQGTVKNMGLIQADGGHIMMSAGARSGLLQTVVNNGGILRARSVTEKKWYSPSGGRFSNTAGTD